MSSIGPIVRGLLIANVAFYLLQLALPGALEMGFALWPLDSGRFGIWQLVSYSFLHSTGTLMHLLFNMFGLFMFGRDLEWTLGGRRFLQLYAVSVVVAAIVQLTFTAAMGSGAPTVGASGGVYGLVLGFAMLFPERRIMLLFPPIPLPARVFAALFVLFELVLGVSNTQSGVAHFAHLGGMLGAFVLLNRWRRR